MAGSKRLSMDSDVFPVKNGFIHFDVSTQAHGGAESCKPRRGLRRWHTDPDAVLLPTRTFAVESDRVSAIDEVEGSYGTAAALFLSSAMSDASTELSSPALSPRLAELEFGAGVGGEELSLPHLRSNGCMDFCTPEPSPRRSDFEPLSSSPGSSAAYRVDLDTQAQPADMSLGALGPITGFVGTPLPSLPASPGGPAEQLSGFSVLDASAASFHPGSQATVATAQAYCEVGHSFQFTLRLADFRGLGLDIVALPDALVVLQVLPDGAVDSWNRCLGDAGTFSRALLPGDVIETVSGATDSATMLEHCLNKELLKISVKRTSAVDLLNVYLGPTPCFVRSGAVGLCRAFGGFCTRCSGCSPKVVEDDQHRLHASKEPLVL